MTEDFALERHGIFDDWRELMRRLDGSDRVWLRGCATVGEAVLQPFGKIAYSISCWS